MLGNITAGGEVIGNLDGTERRYFLKDHVGSVRTTVDRNGNVVGHDDYCPFGLAMPGRSLNSANPNDHYKFTGYELDDEAGLTVYHAGARMYDLVINRFWQIDPLADQYPHLSPYSYVANNPLIYIDPTGEEWYYYQSDDEEDKRWHYHEDTNKMDIWTGEYDDDGNKVMETTYGLDELLSYDGEALRWHQEDGTSSVYFGVSGVLGEDGQTNPSNQWVVDEGPIPEGWYTVDPSQIQDWKNVPLWNKTVSSLTRKHGAWPGGTIAWGKNRVFLSPGQVTGPGGITRSGFSIHGGTFPGSAGCIDLCGNATVFFNAFRKSNNPVFLHVNYQTLRRKRK